MADTTTDAAPRDSFVKRAVKTFFFNIPILGRMLREVIYGDKDNIYYFLFTVLSLWLLAILTWGYAAFILPLLVAVPSMFVVLVLITVGK